ncbi:hypothetical protein [Sneathiella sp.]|uniref:hypothetical protein n=1 Tax=Sneathiella sp. TaxID=1964365 RepID=UPI003568325F
MKGIQRRLERLEKKSEYGAPEMPTCIMFCTVAPGPDGPVNLGPKTAHIVVGPNAGVELSRTEGESVEAFEARVDQLVLG